jgi:hypothetical protein
VDVSYDELHFSLFHVKVDLFRYPKLEFIRQVVIGDDGGPYIARLIFSKCSSCMIHLEQHWCWGDLND